MKILHLNAGNETGGGMFHILSLLKEWNKQEFILGLFEEGEFFYKSEEMGINTVVFSQKNRYDLSVVKQMTQFIRLNNIEVIHTHGARANFYGALIKRVAKIRWVVTIHSDPRDDFMGRGMIGKVYTKLNLSVLSFADHYVAISDRFRRILIEQGIGTAKITTVLNGINFKQSLPDPYSRRSFNLSDKDFIIVMVARLEPVKNHIIALQAIKAISAKDDSVQLLLVGEGSRRTYLEKKVKEFGICQRVKFLGHVEGVEKIYPLADLCLLTSHSESFPLVLLEAARASVPVVTTDVGGVNELIPSEEYGWILSGSQPEVLQKTIEEAIYLKSKDELILKGIRLKNMASQNFSIEKLASNVYNVYLRLIKKNRMTTL
ncbi:glycosyltransferase family 4 protein [Bacillus spongiae]|uniref:Glycosyltransferase family 4 protein n=1 Tax=Bacillus spongiae TaxID=2683610 RepID=A0ABU8HEI1_9BACI